MVFLCIVLKKYFVVLCPTKFLVGTFVSQREESVLQLLPASFTKSFLYLYPLLESMIWTMAGDDVTTPPVYLGNCGGVQVPYMGEETTPSLFFPMEVLFMYFFWS